MKLIIKHIGLFGILFLSAVSIVNAQVLEKKSLTLVGAKQVMDGARNYAFKNNAPGGAIAIVDEGGHLILVERLEGTFAAGANISIGKAQTAAMFKKRTKVFEDLINNGRTTMVTLPNFTPLRGGIPIIFDGQVVGAIGVSGASSAQQDEEIAIAGAESLKTSKKDVAVSYFDGKTVSKSFAVDGKLIDASFGQNYMVNTSLRIKKGESEIHRDDTDIMYVLQGTAKFVTGGDSMDLRQISLGEFRGKGISGGKTHRLKKGDVIVVPKNTPHWFKEVSGTFLYYVVKVR